MLWLKVGQTIAAQQTALVYVGTDRLVRSTVGLCQLSLLLTSLLEMCYYWICWLPYSRKKLNIYSGNEVHCSMTLRNFKLNSFKWSLFGFICKKNYYRRVWWNPKQLDSDLEIRNIFPSHGVWQQACFSTTVHHFWAYLSHGKMDLEEDLPYQKRAW